MPLNDPAEGKERAREPADVYAAARRVAATLERERPERCARWRVDVCGLAEDLGVIVRSRSGMSGRAYWQRRRVSVPGERASLWSPEPQEVDVIEVRADLRDSTRRFAVAHEIGHVIMHRHLQQLAARLEFAERERFANAFAAELLVARSFRETLIARFRDSVEPVGVLRLSDSLGVSPQTLLRTARRENWLKGLDRGWIDIRVLANRHTGRDRRPRVYDAVFDRERWFLPSNRSVSGAFGSDAWLTNADIEIARTVGTLALSRRREHELPRFVRAVVRAQLAAVRLHRSSAPHGMEFLACAGLVAGGAQDAAETPEAGGSRVQIALF